MIHPDATPHRPSALRSLAAVMLAELQALIARPLVLVAPAALLAAVPWLAWAASTPGDPALATSIRGATGVALLFVLPAMAGAIATGVFTTGATRSGLHRAVSRSSYVLGRLTLVLALAFAVGIAALLSAVACTAVASDDRGLISFQRPESGDLTPQRAALGGDGRYWLLPSSDPDHISTLELKLPPDPAGLVVEISFAQGVTPPDRITAGSPVGQPGMSTVPLRVMVLSPDGEQTPAIELFRDSTRIKIELPPTDQATTTQIVHGGSEFSAGLRSSDIRIAREHWSAISGLSLLLLGALLAILPAIACGLAFSVLMSRGTALLAVACVLVVGWLAPMLDIGAKPAIVREAAAMVPTDRQPRGKGRQPDLGVLDWYPALASPSARRLIEAGEMPRLRDLTSQLWSAPWLAATLLLLGLLQLPRRDFGDWQDTSDT